MASSRLLIPSPTLRTIITVHHARSASTVADHERNQEYEDPKEAQARRDRFFREYAKKDFFHEMELEKQRKAKEEFRRPRAREELENYFKREQEVMEKKKKFRELLRRQSSVWIDEDELVKCILGALRAKS